MSVSGWVVGKTIKQVHTAVRQDGVTRSYPLNVAREDVLEVMQKECSTEALTPLCGFNYAVKSGAAFDVGFEVEGWIFWVYSIEPANVAPAALQ